MLTVVKSECGAQSISTNLRRTVQSLKDFTRNPSDTEVYAALKDCNMDANEAAHKLLNQGLFHEVRRKRDKKKESAGFKDFSDHRKQPEIANHPAKFHAADRSFNNVRSGSFPRNNKPEAVQPLHPKREELQPLPPKKEAVQPLHRKKEAVKPLRQKKEAVKPVSRNREFRVVRDNRVNQQLEKETNSAANAGPASDNHSSGVNISETSAMGSSRNHKHSAQGYIPEHINQMIDSRPKFIRDINLSGHRKEQSEEKKLAVPSSVSHPQTAKQGHLPSSTFVEGVCASASDPVHVPSPNSRSPAVKREVGVVGGHRQSMESSFKQISQPSSSNLVVQGISSSTESFRSMNNAPKKDTLNSSSVSQSTSLNTNRAFVSQHHTSRQYQPPVSHQKGALPSKEWRPKSSQMVKVSSPEVVDTPLMTASFSSDNPKVQEADPAHFHEELSEVSIEQVQNVIIAQHIRVPENDRRRLTFGSFGMDITSSEDSASALQATEAHEPATTSGSGEISDVKQLNSLDNVTRNSGSCSSSDVATEQQIPDKEQSTSSVHLEMYSDSGLGRESTPSFPASELQQHQDASEMPNFVAFDPQAAYDISYFRHVDDTVLEQTFSAPQETLTSHSVNSIPASSMAMLQQQQPQLPQMYPQVHVSHFANVMPYRQFISPVYVPPMGLPGYSSNPTYAHPTNANSYVLMPGGNSHLGPANMKYGVQQFKPVPSASNFGNYGSPSGYAINSPGVVGNATGLEDSSRLKYKDNNLYVPNPQAETSEVWREHPGMQSAPYYNMHHQAYMQSHGSFNPGGVAQSSHMQFPGVYQPPPNPHHMATQMGGLGPAAPGAQMGGYQQPQLGHINWTTNF